MSFFKKIKDKFSDKFSEKNLSNEPNKDTEYAQSESISESAVTIKKAEEIASNGS